MTPGRSGVCRLSKSEGCTEFLQCLDEESNSYVCYQGLITLEEGTITEGLIWFRVESYHVVAADGKIFWLSAAPT